LAKYPEISFRMRLTDRAVDLTSEGLDLAFFLGEPQDSNLRMKKIIDVKRVLCASPSYIERHGMPHTGHDLINDKHECLNLRFPGAPEFQWRLNTDEGPKPFRVTGRYESDDGDVLTDWALDGHGIAIRPLFQVADDLRKNRLVAVATQTPPTTVQMACLYTHRKLQDPKTRLFMEFMVDRIADAIKAAEEQVQDPR
ncbi:MAG: substrate binding domain-containing protein, partial [Planktomarina sp.]